MKAETEHAVVLHATIYEVERGLFHVTCRTDAPVPAGRRLPPYHVGASLADARDRIEACARGLGYEAMVWEAPLLAKAITAGGMAADALSRR